MIMLHFNNFNCFFSKAECVLSELVYIFKIKKKIQNTMLRFGVCMVFFIIGLSMTTKVGKTMTISIHKLL